MPDIRVALTITSETAVSVGAAGSAGTLADKSILRDSLERPIIPGSQVKGKMRHAAEALLKTFGLPVQHNFDDDSYDNRNLIRHMFGSPQIRSPLHFADLVCDIEPQIVRVTSATHVRPSVTINRHRGTAEDQRLLIQEVAREGLVFQHHEAIIGQLPTMSHVALLWAALKLTLRWGGAKSRGLGWCRIDMQCHWDKLDKPLSDTELAIALRDLRKVQP